MNADDRSIPEEWVEMAAQTLRGYVALAPAYQASAARAVLAAVVPLIRAEYDRFEAERDEATDLLLAARRYQANQAETIRTLTAELAEARATTINECVAAVEAIHPLPWKLAPGKKEALTRLRSPLPSPSVTPVDEKPQPEPCGHTGFRPLRWTTPPAFCGLGANGAHICCGGGCGCGKPCPVDSGTLPGPTDETTAWVDQEGDVWTLGADGLLHSHGMPPFSREHVEHEWGRLRPVAPLGADREDGKR